MILRFAVSCLVLFALATPTLAGDVEYNGHLAAADRILVIPDSPLDAQLPARIAAEGLRVARVHTLDGRIRAVAPMEKSTVVLPERTAFLTLAVPADWSLDEALDAARAVSGIESAWPDYRHEPAFAPNDPLYATYQSNFPQINVPDAWETTFGDGVIVAVIDSGYRSGMDDAAELVDPYDFWGGDDNVQDFIGHGSHVANVIAEATNNGIGCAGIAPDAKIMPLKVFPDGDGGAYDGDIASAINWATDNGAHVINMSLGGGDFSGVSNSAVNYAHDNNLMVFAATGNDGTSWINYPAGYANTIAIGSSAPHGENGSVQRSSFSNYGDGLALVAPGEGIVQQTWGAEGIGYYGAYGTSVASPHAAGVAALLIAAVGPGAYVNENIKQAMIDTARSDYDDWDSMIGYGEVDAAAALKALGEIAPNSPPDAVIVTDKLAGRAPLTVKFSGEASTDPDNNISHYSWSLPELELKQGPSIEYTFTEGGEFDVVLTVADALGKSDSAVVTVTVSSPKKNRDEDDGGGVCGG